MPCLHLSTKALRSPNWLLAGTRDRRSGRSWDTAAAVQVSISFPGTGLWAEETQAGRPEPPLARKVHQDPQPDPRHPAPKSLSILGLRSVPSLERRPLLHNQSFQPTGIFSRDTLCVGSHAGDPACTPYHSESLCSRLTLVALAIGSALFSGCEALRREVWYHFWFGSWVEGYHIPESCLLPVPIQLLEEQSPRQE